MGSNGFGKTLQQYRNTLIVRMAREGMSGHAIARVVDLTPARVNQILRASKSAKVAERVGA